MHEATSHLTTAQPLSDVNLVTERLPPIIDLGRQHRALSDAHDRLDRASNSASGRQEMSLEASMVTIDERCEALKRLALTRAAVSLGDATVQAAFAFEELNIVTRWDVDNPLPPHQLLRTLRTVRAALSSILAVLASEAGVAHSASDIPD
jgi:hypothetical protein